MKSLAVLALLVVASCNSATADRPLAGAPPQQIYQRLGELPLEVLAPADITITDNTKNAGFPSATIFISPTTFVLGIGPLSDVEPTVERTMAELARDANQLQAFTRTELTADGWILEATRRSMFTGKPLYSISVRRTIAGAPWDCGANSERREDIARVLSLCRSLRAAK